MADTSRRAIDALKTSIKTAFAKTRIAEKALFGRYPFMHDPLQMRVLTSLAEDTRAIPGHYVEIGCAYGATTVWMMKTFEALDIARKGFAYDTFGGFVPEHADHDITALGKAPRLRHAFRSNDIRWMEATLRHHQIQGVALIQGDAARADYAAVAPVALALLDVDLYQPTIEILPKLYDALSPGGIIVVDDCAPDPMWEGALIAYREFMAEIAQDEEIVAGKLGLIRKPA